MLGDPKLPGPRPVPPLRRREATTRSLVTIYEVIPTVTTIYKYHVQESVPTDTSTFSTVGLRCPQCGEHRDLGLESAHLACGGTIRTDRE